MASVKYFGTENLEKAQMGQVVDEMRRVSHDARLPFERRWYDNNFFDDGRHFRYLSRTQNKIVDLSDQQGLYTPLRAIPKASKQIRGVANLLLSFDPMPVVYPEKVNKEAYKQNMQGQQPTIDPQTGQPIQTEAEGQNPEYEAALAESKHVAKMAGFWLEEEMKKQNLLEKLAFMVVLTAKESISFLEIYPDPVREELVTRVWDAFDISILGNFNNLTELPFMGKHVPTLIGEIKANEDYDEEARMSLTPDNKYASSELKQAYMDQKYGRPYSSDYAATIILNEMFIKEYLNDQNFARISKQEDADKVLRGRKKGDTIIRQTFTAAGVTLKDTYLTLREYPFVDLRLEPGALYQTPLMERFIPANKSLDMVVSRIERYLHSMVAGTWIYPKAEGDLEITNKAGGNVIKYNVTAPVQGNIAPIPAFVFEFINLLTGLIEEQGVTTTTLGKIPAGVKAAKAIESLKESEYANLTIATRMLKNTVKRIAETFLDYADDYFVRPQTVYYLEKGEPQYFDVIGNRAAQGRAELRVDEKPLDAIPLKKEYRVEIEIGPGAGYTNEGKKEAMKELITDMTALAQQGFVDPNAMKVVIEKWLEAYNFGSTTEFMEAMDNAELTGNLTDKQLEAIKVAVAEVLKDLQGSEIFPDQQTRIDENKVATAEVIKDAGLMDTKSKPEGDKGPSRSISFKDLPPSGKEQLAAQAGIEIDASEIEADEDEEKQMEQEQTSQEMAMKEKEMQIKEKASQRPKTQIPKSKMGGVS